MRNIIIVSIVGLVIASTCNAGPFFNRRASRYQSNDTNTHNVIDNAPAAPINIGVMPGQNQVCPSCQPTYQQHMTQPIFHQYAPQVIQGSPARVIRQTKVIPEASKDDRIEQIMRAISRLERRLKIQEGSSGKATAIDGDTENVFATLPKVQVIVRNQNDDVVNVVELDTKQWLLDQLNK